MNPSSPAKNRSQSPSALEARADPLNFTFNRETVVAANQHLFEQKQTILAYENQLKSLNSLLQIQISETKHNEEHVSVLNFEVDALKRIVHEKQDIIHDLKQEILKLEDKIVHLENELDQNKINKLALYQLEQQNQQLLERIKESHGVIHEKEIENTFLKNHKKDKLLIEENDIKKLQELGIKYPNDKHRMMLKMQDLENEVAQQRESIRILEEKNQSFYHLLKWNQEAHSEKLTRSKLFEYKVLMELDYQAKEKRLVEEEKKSLLDNSKMIMQKSNELNTQLSNAYDNINQMQQMYSVVIDTLEKEQDVANYREKLLIKENYLLQTEKQLMNEIIQKTSRTSTANFTETGLGDNTLGNKTALSTSTHVANSSNLNVRKTATQKSSTPFSSPKKTSAKGLSRQNVPSDDKKYRVGDNISKELLSKSLTSLPTSKSEEFTKQAPIRPMTMTTVFPDVNNDAKLLAENTIESEPLCLESSDEVHEIPSSLTPSRSKLAKSISFKELEDIEPQHFEDSMDKASAQLESKSPDNLNSIEAIEPEVSQEHLPKPTVVFNEARELITFHKIKNSFFNKYFTLFIEYAQYYQFVGKEVSYLMTQFEGFEFRKAPSSFDGNLFLNDCGITSDDLNLVCMHLPLS